KSVYLKVEQSVAPYTTAYEVGQVLQIPIAHGEGCFVAPDAEVDALEDAGRIIFRYCEEDGSVTAAANPNGSVRNIAGIVNAEGNVLGMMPHPERAVDMALGSTDGIGLFESLAEHLGGLAVR